MDFGLAMGTIENPTGIAYAFQCKRFIGKSASSFNEDLAAYANKILAKYRPGEINLIIIAEIEADIGLPPSSYIDIEKIRQSITIVDGSFIGGFLLHFDSRPLINQLWPRI